MTRATIKPLHLSLLAALVTAFGVGVALWFINPEKSLFPATFVFVCLVLIIPLRPGRDLVNIYRDAHWSHNVAAIALTFVSLLNVKSIVNDAYFVPMAASFATLLLAVATSMSRKVRKQSD